MRVGVLLIASACGRLGFGSTDAVVDARAGDGTRDTTGDVTIVAPTWSVHFPGSGVGHLHDVVVRPDRSIIAGAHFDPDIDVGYGVQGSTGTDIMISARVPSGAPLWRYAPAGSGNEETVGLTSDDGGSVYMSGWFDGNFRPMPPLPAVGAVSGIDGFVVALDPGGAPRWSLTFGDAGDDYGLGVAVSGSTLCLAGQVSSMADFGGGPRIVTGPDVFVAGFDALTGTHKWSKTIGVTAGAGGQGRTDVVAVPGGCAVVGMTTGEIDFGNGSLGIPANRDLFVAMLDPDTGNAIWSRRYAQPGVQSGSSIAADSDGSLVVAAVSDAGFDFGVPTPSSGAGSGDVFVVRLDPDGDPRWSTMVAAGPLADVMSGALAVLADRSIIVGGEFRGTADLAGTPATSAGMNDLFVVQLDPAGQPRWALAAGAASEDAVFAAAADPAGGAIVGGHFGSSVTLGQQTFTALGYSDTFLLRLDQPPP